MPLRGQNCIQLSGVFNQCATLNEQPYYYVSKEGPSPQDKSYMTLEKYKSSYGSSLCRFVFCG